MNKTKNNSIVFGLKMLSILAFSLLIIPRAASADSVYPSGIVYNPVPMVTSISPSSINENITSNTITITGGGFMPTSIARVNGSDRLTTFIDHSHILIKLNGDDLSKGNGFYVNVFNGAPEGGYSNASYFTIKNVVTTANTNSGNNNNTNSNVNSNVNKNTPNSSATKSNTNTYTSANTTNTTNETNDDNSNYSNLASNAIFGSNGFMPSGLMQWILFAIIILLLVILVRKLFGARKNYEESPMKHA